MSTDYYARLEQQRGPQPSEQMLEAIARALRLSRAERDHLFRLAGRVPETRGRRCAHVSPGLLHVLDNLDTPAQVISDLGHTLVQNPAAVALVGDETQYTGLSRAIAYRWFRDPGARRRYPAADWDEHGRTYVALLRRSSARADRDPEAIELVERLRAESPEFATLWERHDVDHAFGQERKRFLHPEVGALEVDCQVLVAENEDQVLLVYTATPRQRGPGEAAAAGRAGRAAVRAGAVLT